MSRAARRHASRAAGLWLALLLLAWGSPSRAELPGEPSCARSFEHAQELRARGQPMAARDELLVCAEICSDELRRYCVTWLAEVESELASVVIVARRGGADLPLAEVKVVVDGALREPQRGRIVLMPGMHRIELQHRGETVAQQVRLEAGGQPISVVATFGAAPAPAPPPAERGEGAPAVSWVLFGIGGAALTAALVLAINGHLLRGELVDSCSPYCHPESIVPIERQWIASGVLAGVGASMLIGGGIVAGVGGDDALSVSLRLRGRF